jgi:hypothetical protein
MIVRKETKGIDPCPRKAIRCRTRRRNERKPVSVRCLGYGTNFPEAHFWGIRATWLLGYVQEV